jgi:O-6-methylguanine DNA methyltransferase
MKRLITRGDVRYSLYKSPVGFLYLLGTDYLLHAIAFKNRHTSGADVETLFKKGIPAQVESAVRFFNAYFDAGKARSEPGLSLKTSVDNTIISVMFAGHTSRLDLSDFTPKEIAVYRELLKIPSGKAISYLKLSEKAGIPSGARFVGNAMAGNAFPIIIPCHRVIKSGGAIGNYSGGIGIKEFLLRHEGYKILRSPDVSGRSIFSHNVLR